METDITASPRHSISVPEHHHRHAPPLYGVMAEFENPTDLVAAARKATQDLRDSINAHR